MKRFVMFVLITLVCANCGCLGGSNATTQNASATTSLAPATQTSDPMAATVSDSPASSVTMPTGTTLPTNTLATEAPAAVDTIAASATAN